MDSNPFAFPTGSLERVSGAQQSRSLIRRVLVISMSTVSPSMTLTTLQSVVIPFGGSCITVFLIHGGGPLWSILLAILY